MKGFVFVASHLIYLRFVLTHAFDDLEAQHDIIYVSTDSPENAGLRADLAEKQVVMLPYYALRYNAWKDWFNISCYKYRDRSPSFAIRIEEIYKGKPHELDKIRRISDHYQQAKEKQHTQIPLHPELLALCRRERPDFLVLPSPILDSMTDDVIQVARALNIPIVLLVAGWDNLSSKGLLFEHPTAIGVWGQQSTQHAQIVQDIPEDRIQIIGAPHYEIFRQDAITSRVALRQKWGFASDQQVVLFAGTFRLFDETDVLCDLEQAIERGDLPPMHIVYRPHPWRTHRPHEKNFYNYTWKHVTMDPTMAEVYQLGHQQASSINSFLFEQQHLRDLYSLVDAVICPMSTVLLEAMIFGLPILAVAFGDGKHSWSADKVAEMMHFKEMYDIPEVIVCRERTDFFPAIRQLLALIPDQQVRRKLQDSTDYFVHIPHGSTYASRVLTIVNNMLAKAPAKPDYDAISTLFQVSNHLKNMWYNHPRLIKTRRHYQRLKRRIQNVVPGT